MNIFLYVISLYAVVIVIREIVNGAVLIAETKASATQKSNKKIAHTVEIEGTKVIPLKVRSKC